MLSVPKHFSALAGDVADCVYVAYVGAGLLVAVLVNHFYSDVVAVNHGKPVVVMSSFLL